MQVPAKCWVPILGPVEGLFQRLLSGWKRAWAAHGGASIEAESLLSRLKKINRLVAKGPKMHPPPFAAKSMEP